MPDREDDVAKLRQQAQEMVGRLLKSVDDDTIRSGIGLVDELRRSRQFSEMTKLAEVVSRNAPKDARTRRLYAQGLIESGKLTAAADVLSGLARRLPKTDAEWAEAKGLQGRVNKQLFIEAGDTTAAPAREALKAAIAAYRAPFEADPAAHTWHGVNLAALLIRARNLKMRVAPDLDPAVVAQRVADELTKVPAERRDSWYHTTFAEAALASKSWSVVEEHLAAYLKDGRVTSFNLGSTLRQFTEVWNLEDDQDRRGRGIVSALRAKLMSMPGGQLDLNPEQFQRQRETGAVDESQLQAILGADGPKTVRWMQTGLDRARSVAAVRQKMGGCIGTGFLVSATSLGFKDSGASYLVTNYHVVNTKGDWHGERPNEVEIVFEQGDPGKVYEVANVLWESPPDKLDTAVLCLSQPVLNIPGLPIAANLPALEEGVRVYIIGHPGGRELSFSMQDNELIDHEGTPNGTPIDPAVRKVHYRAPTEGGSSGSPVFNSRLWEVIALHHSGGKDKVRRLNGKDGTYGANEGISIQSIREAIM